MSDEKPTGLFSRGRLQEPMGPRLIQRKVLIGLTFALSVGVGILACYRFIVWVRGLGGELGFGGVVFLLAIPVIFAVVACVYAVAVAVPLHRATERGSRAAWRGFMVISIVAVVLIYLGMVQPIREANEAEARRQAAVAAQLKAEATAKLRAWLAEVHAKGAYGPPGTVPPMLKVDDQGLRAQVTVVSRDRGPTLQLNRVLRDPGTGRWMRCAMVTEVAGLPTTYIADLPRSRALNYVLSLQSDIGMIPDPSCAAAFRGAPLEFRIGLPGSEPGWWTDSALEEAGVAVK